MKCRIFFLLIIIVMFGCDRDKSTIKGHWVSVDYFKNRSYKTLDINDSFIVFNKYSWRNEVHYYHDTLNKYSCLYGHNDQLDIYLRNDTIIIDGSEFSSPFVRIDSLLTSRDDVFCELLLKVNPPLLKDEKLVGFPRRSLMSEIGIGKLREGYSSDSMGIKPDSFLIQVNDVFINLNTLSHFVKSEKAKLDPVDRDSIAICLNADKDTPKTLLDDVLKTIRFQYPKLKIYRAYVNLKDKNILYGRMN